MKTQKKDFQLDIRLGLAIIVLVLLILNFAAHYTLLRITHTVKNQAEERLSEAAVVVFNKLKDSDGAPLPDSLIEAMMFNYNLTDINIVEFNHDRARAIRNNSRLDDKILAIDSSLKAEILKPLLTNESVFVHNNGESQNLFIQPEKIAGLKYLIAVAGENPLLASLEKAVTILIYSAILGILVILYTARKFSSLVLSPYKKLKEKAARVGRLDPAKDVDIDRLVASYEEIIDDLKLKETELRRLNDLIRKRADHLEVHNENILRSIDTGIITLDNGKKIGSVNPAVEKILGLENDTGIEGATYQEFFRHYGNMKEELDEFFNSGEAIRNRQVDIEIAGNRRIILFSVSHLIESARRPSGFMVILNDQTDIINLQQELELKERMAVLGEMSGGLAHQLRNSIGGMVGFARLIERRINDEKTQKNIGLLLKETSEAEKLISRFLNFARPLEPQITEISAAGILKDLIDKAAERYKKITFELNPIKPGLFFNADQLLLKQAIGNIIDNACNAADKDGGHISIDTAIHGNMVQIIIRDNGHGIPASYGDKIFTPFFSGSPSGTGLGLPLARKIILGHEGRIDYETGQDGTTFIISLPMTRHALKSVVKSGNSNIG
jgi:PAS domain S-box-containing protein